ncbi:MAG: FecR domain-containing protein [Reichenbachiella sp.]|uniref:FecR family protein n=1 Tax=Reichenbachiella sp. TaxID=2184521 RepID=UPI0032991D9F
MSEKNRHSVSEELLFRYFLNEVSPDEQDIVLSWKAESEQNLEEFARVRMVLLDINAVNSIGKGAENYDASLAWKKFQQVNHVRKTSSFTWLKIAASIILILGAGWFTYVSNRVETLELIVQNEQQAIELEDGSKISLNEGSQLIYPDKFKGSNRKVQLKGEAYFEVAHNPEQPFLIETDEVEVQVLGTKFNVNNTNKDSVVVSVDSGKVRMSVGGKEEILTAGYRGVYYRSTELLVKIETANTGMHNYWRTKTLAFKGATVSEAVNAIQKVYGVKVKLSNPEIANCKINVDFENEEIEHVLEIIGETLNLVWSNQGDAYLLAGYGCPQ